MAAIKAGTNFPTTLVTEVYNKVKGHSSIAKMVPSAPIAFNGNTEFTFSLDNEIAIVGESAEKPAGDGAMTPVTIRPIKVVYQSRVSDEFLYASEEAQLKYLEAFTDGYAKKIAKGLDLMVMHGVNPYSGTASQTIGTNNLDSAITTNVVEYYGANVDKNIEEAIGMVDDANGLILSKIARDAIATLETDNGKKYPEFAWGAVPASLGGMTVDANATVSANSNTARAYVGNWDALKWGFAKEMPLEVIEFGNPDGQGDLKRTNEVVLRSEAYIGWGILDASAFAKVSDEE